MQQYMEGVIEMMDGASIGGCGMRNVPAGIPNAAAASFGAYGVGVGASSAARIRIAANTVAFTAIHCVGVLFFFRVRMMDAVTSSSARLQTRLRDTSNGADSRSARRSSLVNVWR